MKNFNKVKYLIPLLLLFTFIRGGCVTKTNEPDLRLQNMNYYIGLGGNTKAKEKLLSIISGAKTEIVGVFNDLSDTDVSSALINKANAGLKVAIGGDRRNENNAGFAALKGQRSSNKFLDYFTAQSTAAAESNQNLKNKILATRLNFNGLNRNLKYNAKPFDGRVEYNFVVADKYNCWVSTGGANDTTFATGYSVVFVFQSFDICNDFYNEAQQLVYGGLFGDEGVPSFGKFANNKSINDPNTRFRLGDLIFNIYFAPQEKPLVPVVTELLRAESSIKFAARALTQDIINDITAHPANRSSFLSALQYKARIPQVFGGAFSVQGVVGFETGTNDTDVPLRTGVASCAGSDAAFSTSYNSLVSGTCPTINTVTTTLPFMDTNPCPLRQTITNQSSIHCDLKTLNDSINNTSVADLRKYPVAIPFNVFLTDYGKRKPRIILMSSDLRKRFFYDEADSQAFEPKRTQNDYLHITDAFVMIIEPAGSTTNMNIFDDFNTLVTRLISGGGAI